MKTLMNCNFANLNIHLRLQLRQIIISVGISCVFSEYNLKLLTWKGASPCCTAANHPTFEYLKLLGSELLSLFNQCEQMLGADFLNCLNVHPPDFEVQIHDKE